MALSGIEFVCKTDGCICCNTGFTMASTWPLGDIDNVIAANKGNEDYIEGMTRLKAEGRNYACIKMPNKENIPIVGYRIQKWCDKCKAPRLFDAIMSSPEQSMEDTIKEANISEFCFKCGEKLMVFSELADENGGKIECPSCSNKLTVRRWFVNERED